MNNIDDIFVDEAKKCGEGSVYSSSLGMFGDESNKEITNIKSVNFNDYLHETSTEAKKFDTQKEYVFIRNISGVYKNIFQPANFLNKGIKLVDGKVSKKDKHFFNHSTMSVSLKDGFIGLTFDGTKYSAKYEYVTDIDKNRYTSTCNPNKSKYTVYGIEVSKKERKDIEGMLTNAVHNANINYDIFTNFLIGLRLIVSKFVPDKKEEKSIESKKFSETNFVCSTFIAYILSKCCPTIADAYKNKRFNYNRLSPNQLINETPHKHKLFEGVWSDYNKDLAKFLEKHPEMKKYNK